MSGKNEKFDGFRPRRNLKNYTQIPNEFFEMISELDGAELKILLIIFRQTYGWVKEIINGEPVYKTKDYISISQFEEKTGLSRNWIIKKLKQLRNKGLIIKVENYDFNNTNEKPANAYAVNQARGSEVSSPPPSEVSSPTKKTNTKNKTEEEEREKIPSKFDKKFQQVFNRKLSVDLYQKIIEFYSDLNILMKALEISEENADKPSYILQILADWQNNGLASVSQVNAYLKKRKASKSRYKPNTGSGNHKDEDLYNVEKLKKKGWN